MLRVLDYIETISFGYVLYCVCFFNLYNGCFNLYCNMWVCVCVGVLVIYVLVFTVFCIVCTVFCFVYLFIFALFVLV